MGQGGNFEPYYMQRVSLQQSPQPAAAMVRGLVLCLIPQEHKCASILACLAVLVM